MLTGQMQKKIRKHLKSQNLHAEMLDDFPTTTRPDIMSVLSVSFLRGCVKLKIVQMCVETLHSVQIYCAQPANAKTLGAVLMTD